MSITPTYTQPIERIFIWGMMGSGKSSLGKKLAETMGWEFVDTDQQIQQNEGLSVAQIFERSGEKDFRLMEASLIEACINKNHAIISTGGGVPCHHNLDDLMLSKGLCIWLDAPSVVLAHRLRNNKEQRPLLQDIQEGQMAEELNKLLKKRMKNYRKAHFIVQAHKITPTQLLKYVQLAIQGKW